ncbi:hypothetical protein ACFWNN_24870 [Lentzea sp. NPDC058450]|uniref:hypothetical protein n=1 Tax=Lentzea sp. NPDC058450 TaxID=3346505 RepID=UPI003656D4CE
MIVVGLVVYLFSVGLDEADKVGSSIGGVIAFVALGAPYLLPQPRKESLVPDDPQVSDDVVVENSGDAEATGGGVANAGVETVDGGTGAVRVTGSGKAVANGPGSVANTGVRRLPRS